MRRKGRDNGREREFLRLGHVILTFRFSLYFVFTAELPGQEAKHVQQGCRQVSRVREQGGREGGREGGMKGEILSCHLALIGYCFTI